MIFKEIIQIVIIPVAVALLPLIWGLTASLFRRVQFRNLILREIEEIGPFPAKKPQNDNKKSWTNHHTKKRFLHKEIFEKPTENRDFILSLSPSLVYYVTQLWQSAENANQWLFMLWKIKTEIPFWQIQQRNKIESVKNAWYILMKEYDIKFEDELDKSIRPKVKNLSESEIIRLKSIEA